MKVLEIQTLKDGYYLVDEEGFYYEDYKEFAEYLCEPHKENYKIVTLYEADIGENNELISFINDEYLCDVFDELFEKAWNFALEGEF